MKQLVENNYNVSLNKIELIKKENLDNYILKVKENDVLLFSLPADVKSNSNRFINLVNKTIATLPENITIGIMGENEDLAYISYGFEHNLKLKYGNFISLRKEIINKELNGELPNETAGVVFFTKKNKLKLARVLLPYTYCPACGKTTKDYGGKKHTFHEYGTTMSDVWKDIFINKNDPFPADILNRLQDMFSVTENISMHVLSLYNFKDWDEYSEFSIDLPPLQTDYNEPDNTISFDKSTLFCGDSLEILYKLPTSSVDYIFVDPPYNLKKKYASYGDALEIEDYFTWCDQWLHQCYRVLKPGRHLSILNIPNWAIRHYAYLNQLMEFDSWVTWDALSKPGGKIMPANYTILTFKKPEEENTLPFSPTNKMNLKSEADYYCLRKSCKNKREVVYKQVTDLWTDIHRIKHNSKRFDHPCQLPPALMKRLINIYTNKGDFVLDCFNGVGTTTLSAEVLNRNYIGIELDSKYHNTAEIRHEEVKNGLDPFRKNDINVASKTKNNDVKRISKKDKNYSHITKKEVQLKIKDLSVNLGRTPSKEDALDYLPEIPKEFYELYFSSWSEVTVSVNVGGVPIERNSYKGKISSRREDTIVK